MLASLTLKGQIISWGLRLDLFRKGRGHTKLKTKATLIYSAKGQTLGSKLYVFVKV